MAIKEWVTTFTGDDPVQDPEPVNVPGVQEDLDDESFPEAGDGDPTRSSQLEAIRDKAQALAKLLGDSANAPAGSVTEILDRDHANGEARFFRLLERAADPAVVSNRVFLYAKDDGGVAKAYVEWDDGTVLEIGAASPSPLTTKGDLFGFDTGDARIPVGADGLVLTADSAEALGLKWAAAGGTAVTQQNVLYVGKHGNDGNDGTSVERAFLTFGAALAAASSGDTVVCLDDGVYVEEIVVPDLVNVYAPNAEFQNPGNADEVVFTLEGTSSIKVRRVEVQYGGFSSTAFVAESGNSHVDVNEVILKTNGTGFKAVGGTVRANCRRVYSPGEQTKAFVSGDGASSGTIFLNVEEIYSGDVGITAVEVVGNGGSSYVFGRIGRLAGDWSTGIDVDGGAYAYLNIGEIASTVTEPWDVGATGHLFLFVGKNNGGAPTETGEVMVTEAGVGSAALNEEEFSTTGAESPGDPTTFGPLTNTPLGAAAANTPSGYDLLVFRNGIKMKYAAVPSSYQEYFYDSGNNEIDVLASGDADEYEVVYRS